MTHPHRFPQVLATGLQQWHRPHQSLQEISRESQTRASPSYGLHRGRNRHAASALLRLPAIHAWHRSRIPNLGQCDGSIGLHRSRRHHSLYHRTVYRQQQRESQREDRLAEHSRCLHTADGLRMRISFCMVEEMRTGTERIQRIQQDFLQIRLPRQKRSQ